MHGTIAAERESRSGLPDAHSTLSLRRTTRSSGDLCEPCRFAGVPLEARYGLLLVGGRSKHEFAHMRKMPARTSGRDKPSTNFGVCAPIARQFMYRSGDFGHSPAV
jgi:hypothetical protein